ncbi:phage regulatory protein, partial [Bacillus thuringiensis]
MKQLTAANKKALVFKNNGRVVTDSLMIAEMFEKT